MLQLIECSSRDHTLDLAERLISTQAARIGRHPQPHFAAAALYHAGQSAVVDNLAPDGLDSTHARQRFRANQDTAASGASHFAPRIPNPLRRIQHEEKEDERRNQQLLREASETQSVAR